MSTCFLFFSSDDHPRANAREKQQGRKCISYQNFFNYAGQRASSNILRRRYLDACNAEEVRVSCRRRQ